MTFSIEVSGFDNGGEIPAELTCDGKNHSPRILLNDIPKGTKSLALVVEDPDAPVGLFVHWVIFNINSDIPVIRENIEKSQRTSEGFLQGKNDFGRIGYDGPCPPKGHGYHRYFFRMFALGGTVTVDGAVSRDRLLKAIEGKVLSQAEYVGKYKR
ncbi:MAG: YbhB/YbcL family Raf kinase inhibitor-like protein [Candidatus Thermoplasmatota archaeon]|jgi:Raf kinase inhibitor-like YbhB/YbcL family protein|nr:YbhB/YbcL family Raf kinase inhibitor-like protein [Candidatus Thermoplasmatota archaeon]MCL5789389.1 YbhB/YbcL family Raf kinase inhibitor-like protein [Candidatus Thermoplasmatota archaeon]